jgi:hypothetical protein
VSRRVRICRTSCYNSFENCCSRDIRVSNGARHADAHKKMMDERIEEESGGREGKKREIIKYIKL